METKEYIVINKKIAQLRSMFFFFEKNPEYFPKPHVRTWEEAKGNWITRKKGIAYTHKGSSAIIGTFSLCRDNLIRR